MNLNTPLSEHSRVLKLYSSRLEKLEIRTLHDLLFHIPARYEDLSLRSSIDLLQPGEVVTIEGSVLEMKTQYTRSRFTLQKAVVADKSGSIEVLWFNQPYLTNVIKPNSEIAISGTVDTFKGKSVFKPQEYEVLHKNQPENLHTGRIVPVYPETRGVSSKWLRRQIFNLLQPVEVIDDHLPEEILKDHNLMQLSDALRTVHFPQSIEQVNNARKRLAFDELLQIHLIAKHRRKQWSEDLKGVSLPSLQHLEKLDKLYTNLPFTLTRAQQKAFAAIQEDFKKGKVMNRLLQGDVGSGKTIVAALSMYLAYLNGYQSALMAPTEILAEQHYKSISQLLEPSGIKVSLVTGSNKPRITPKARLAKSDKKQESSSKKKNDSIDSKFMIRDSNFDILIGTHALLQKSVTFDNLALVVIDEQQRFGVEQRGIIRNKGENPHLLTMTATPIPRTIALTMYGDLDLSYLDEMPKGRRIIRTWLVPTVKRDKAYDWIRKQIYETNSQAFIICPFIEESENMVTVKAATTEFERLKTEIFPDLKLGLLHGKLKGKEKDDVLEKFRNKKFDILVATPVVEVGIDIPNATIIVIEASERFGLSQLHQLRGRVGRGDKQSFCLLFTESENSKTLEKLKALETLHIGAELAELDLKLRGPGEMYGTSQSGRRMLKVASFSDTKLIEQTKNAAVKIYNALDKYPLLAKKLAATDKKIVSPD